MPKRHNLARKKPTVQHSNAEKKRLRALKRRSGPSAMRRRERRAGLQSEHSSAMPPSEPAMEDEIDPVDTELPDAFVRREHK